MKSMVNKRVVKNKRSLKQIQKNGKKIYIKGNRKVLKNYIGKLIDLKNQELIGTEKIVDLSAAVNTVSEEALLKHLDESKLTGMSGGGFPVLEKVTTFMQSSSQHKKLIVNGVECEPGLKQDEWLLHNRFDEICKGIEYIGETLKITELTIAVKENIISNKPEIKIRRVPARFPMGEEHYMIQAVTGIHMEKNIIPAKEGILVMNVQTVYQIYKLMNDAYEGKRFVTLANTETGEGRIAYVSASDKVSELLTVAFGSSNLGAYAGDGILRTNTTTKTTDFGTDILFAALGKENSICNENKCKKCGACAKKCPVGIPVHKIVQAREKDLNADISMYHPERCIQCGSCVYFCSADKLPGVYVNYKQE